MTRREFLIYCCAFSTALVCSVPLARSDGLPPTVVAALKRAQIPSHNIAIFAQRQNQALPAIAHHASKPMQPASVMKLVTTYAALDILGPAYVWRSEMLSDAPVENGTLKGNLYLKGSGDPKITLERFWLWLRDLRASGIESIAGDVVLDQSLFDVPAEASIDSDPSRAYNTEPRALIVNFNSTRLRLSNGGNASVDIDMLPALAALKLSNRLKIRTGACEAWRENISTKLVSTTNGATLNLNGSFPRNCAGREMYLNALPADIYIGELFKSLWHELGGKLEGIVRAGTTPKTARVITVLDSDPLSLLIRDINKFSNNLMTRQLLLTLGARNVVPATPRNGVDGITQWLNKRNLAMPELVMENGSGLSRRERISAHSLGRLLSDAYRHPLSAEFVSSLPIAGVDGTMKSRLVNTSVANFAHIKSGALENVRSVAGYVIDRTQAVWVVVAIVNDAAAENAIAVFDALLVALREQTL